ncbi:MAG TPA: glycosyltransferase [Thiothrix sp.]|nr:glycosyltransferase [Thiothrix sp.]
MKIAFLIQSLGHGGAERTVSNLSFAMEKEQHDVTVILFDARDNYYPHGGRLIDLNIIAKSNALGKAITLLKRTLLLRKLFKKEQFDAIYSFLESSGLPSTLASRETVTSVRDDPAALEMIYHKLIPRIYPSAKKVVACSKAIENILIKDFGLKNTTTIYNAIDIEKVVKLSTEDIEETAPFILAVGRLDKQKGFDFLIEAFAASHASETLKLIILGEGEERGALNALIQQHQLEDKVLLKGSVVNPFAYYSKAKFFTLSSRHEGFPNILLEALACRCPCISFDCPTGPNEIIQHNENGLLVDAENVAALTDAINTLHGNTAMQEKFKQNAQASIQHLNFKNITNQWLSLIKTA